MKKPKMSLGPDGIKGLFVQHVEKMVFGFSILSVLVFVVLGVRIKSDLGDKSPPKLETLAANAVKHIERPTFDEVRKERTPRDGKGGQYYSRVDNLADASPTNYETPIPWKPLLGDPGQKREDPEVFPPIKLEMTPMTGPICLTNKDEIENPVAALENAPSTVKKKRPKRKRRSSYGGYGEGDGEGYGMGGEGYGMGGEGYGMDGEEGYGMGGEGYPGSRRGKSKRGKSKKQEPKAPPRKYEASKVCGYRPAGVSTSSSYGMSGGMEGYGMGGEGYGMGGEGYGMGGEGYGMGGEGYGMGATNPARLPLGQTQHIIAVKALAPYRKQVDEFKRVLGSAVGFDPNRDTPRIIFFQAQRADVTDDPNKELADSDWKSIMNPKKAAQIANDENWHGIMQEVADRTYVDRNVTMPSPPMMVRCMEDVLLHSEVPKSSVRPTMKTPDAEDDEKEDDTKKVDDDLPGGSNLPGGRGFPGFPGRGMASGGMGYGMDGGMGYGMDGGMGYEMDGGMGYGMDGEMGSEGYGMDGGMGYGMDGGMGYGMDGGMGYGMDGGMGYGYGGRSASAEPVQYKLVRFFDTSVKPGRIYRYRIRLFVEDPNSPNTDPANGRVNMPPRRRTLSMKVIERLKKQESESEKSPYYVITDWSEASDPVSLTSTSRVFVSEVSPARFSSGANNTLIQQSEVNGTIVPVVWHDTLAIDVSKKLKAYRGSVLDIGGQFEVLDPVTLDIKLLKDFELRSQFLVVDMRGGEDLPGDRDNKVKSIGEFVLFDGLGNFTVHDELDDFDRFQRFTLADEIKPAESAYGMGGMGYPGGEGEEYGSDYGSEGEY